MIPFLIVFFPVTAVIGLGIVLYLTNQFVNLSFIMIRMIIKGFAKLFGKPKINLGRYEKVWQSFNDYFEKVADIWGRSNRLDYLVGIIWSYIFAILINYLFYKHYGDNMWQWIQQFSDKNLGYVHHYAPSKDLSIGIIKTLILNLYWFVPWVSLTIRRCRSMGNAGLFFLNLVPVASMFLPILCLVIPEKPFKQTIYKEYDENKDFSDRYGDRK